MENETQSDNTAQQRKQLGLVLRIAVSGGLLIWVITRTEPRSIIANISQANLLLILVGFTLFQAGVLLRTIRWQMILKANNVTLSFSSLLRLNYSGMFFNTFLPTGFGGDVVRMLEIAQGTEGKGTTSAGTVIMDRLIGLVAMFAICVVALPFGYRVLPRQTVISIAIIAGGGLLGLLVLMDGTLVRLAQPMIRHLPFNKQILLISNVLTGLSWYQMLAILLISLVYNGLIVVIHYIVSRSYGMSIGFRFFGIFTPIVALSLVAPSVQGLGVREGTYSFLLSQAGVAIDTAVAFSLTIYAINFVSGLLGGIVYLIYAAQKAST